MKDQTANESKPILHKETTSWDEARSNCVKNSSHLIMHIQESRKSLKVR